MIVSAAETEVRDFYWLKRHIPDDAHCVLTNVTSGMGVISIMGPKARDLLQSLTPDDMSHAGFPFATSREIEWASAMCARRGLRLSVSWAGSSISRPSSCRTSIDRIAAAGALNHGWLHAGYHALNSLRSEKAYRHWSHDITDEDSPLEAGLGFVVKWDKPGGFMVARSPDSSSSEQGLSTAPRAAPTEGSLSR